MSYRRSAWLLVATLVATLFPTGAFGSSASTTSLIPEAGAQFHAMWQDYTDAERIEVLDKLQAAGIKWVRIDYGWSSMQPTDSKSYASWYLSRADRVVDAARARGIKVLMMFWRTPDWANGGKGPYVPPTDPAEFGKAAGYMANHFKGRVAAWEVWNEPNHGGGEYWKGTIPQYVGLLKAAYKEIKAVDPAAKVVAGSVCYNDDAWLKSMYDAGAKGHFDVISTHPYQGVADEAPELKDNGTKWRLSHVPAVYQLMVSRGDGHKEIWFTEFGWSDHVNTGSEGNWARGVTPQQQADYAVRSFKYVAANFPYVKNMFWYNERNRATGKPQLDNYGLLTRDLKPKPVYDSLKKFLTSGLDLPPADDVISPSPSPTSSSSPSPSDPPPAEDGSSEPEPQPTTSPSPKHTGGKKKNLLRNGSFERGITSWSTHRAALRTVARAKKGTKSGRIRTRSQREARVSTSAYEVPSAGSVVELNGYLKPRARRQSVRVVVSEVVGEETVALSYRNVRSRGKKWQAFPTLRHKVSGIEGATLRVLVRPIRMKGRGVLVDGLRLTEVH